VSYVFACGVEASVGFQVDAYGELALFATATVIVSIDGSVELLGLQF
jgi:hypothetical protein